jgi:hypothetical protein
MAAKPKMLLHFSATSMFAAIQFKTSLSSDLTDSRHSSVGQPGFDYLQEQEIFFSS